MTQHWGPTGGPATGPVAPAPRRPGPGPLIAIGVLAFVLVAVLIAAVGGVVHLATRNSPGPTEPAAPTVLEGTGYTLEAPSGWEQFSGGESFATYGGDLAVRGPEHRIDDAVVHDEVLVYRYDISLHAVASCRFDAVFMGSDFDVDSGDPEELEEVELGGKPAAHHRVVGSLDGQDAVEELWCVDVGEDVVAIYATNYATGELTPETLAIVQSIVWTED